jgi:hypothetical protein
LIIIYEAYLEYNALHFALAEESCRSDRYIHSEKNVTYNIALESTTYVKLNVTLGVTLQHGNITFVRLAPTPAQRTGAGLILAVLNF